MTRLKRTAERLRLFKTSNFRCADRHGRCCWPRRRRQAGRIKITVAYSPSIKVLVAVDWSNLQSALRNKSVQFVQGL